MGRVLKESCVRRAPSSAWFHLLKRESMKNTNKGHHQRGRSFSLCNTAARTRLKPPRESVGGFMLHCKHFRHYWALLIIDPVAGVSFCVRWWRKFTVLWVRILFFFLRRWTHNKRFVELLRIADELKPTMLSCDAVGGAVHKA